MRILVTGAAGLLGSAVVRTAGERGHDVRAFPRSALDVTDPGQVDRRLRAEKPEVVIHCAAYTAVDRAEEESDQAMCVNRDGTRNVAMAAAEIGATVSESDGRQFGDPRGFPRKLDEGLFLRVPA